MLELAPVMPLHVLATLNVALLGFAISVCVSLPLGIPLALSSVALKAIVITHPYVKRRMIAARTALKPGRRRSRRRGSRP